MKRQDLIVIGGGVGGLVVTSVAAQLGLKVTLIEKTGRLGGDCLHYGCVPSKTLIMSARVASLMRRGAEFGLGSHAPDVNLRRVMAHVAEVIGDIQKHDSPERFEAYGARVMFGAPRFIDAHRVEVEGETLRGRRFVVATGSRPDVPPIAGLAEAGFLTNETVFDLESLPARLLVLGGGPVGVELGQAFARLGSAVVIAEAGDRLLPAEDPEVGAELASLLRAEGIEVHTGLEVASVEREGEAAVLRCGSRVLRGDALLVATGRRPHVEGLGLEAAGVDYDDRKGIRVDPRLRTSQKHIYACGDVCGPFPFTHMAEYQAGIVLSNAVFRWPKKADYSVVPRVTYSDPEVARVGRNEAEARDGGIDFETLRFDFADIDRAKTAVERKGFAKLLVSRRRIIGATVIGPHAGELLAELVLAMHARVRIGSISGAIHAYPTLAEITRRAVNLHYARKLFSPWTRRLVRFINVALP
ncbi:MAG TPA: FAD-dependent oxidoreductase [Gammaproteobacteria bacterium]|nr:FAD-dependent oxidoreductase [Gammaproteobacteria bacterium]